MRIIPRSTTALAEFAARPVAVPGPVSAARDPITSAIMRTQVETISRDEAMHIPAVRNAVHVIAGTISTFTMSAWKGTTRLPDGTIPWLGQPDPARTLNSSLRRVVEDLIWYDRAYWKVTRDISGAVVYLTRIRPDRVVHVHDPNDVDAPGDRLLDGNRTAQLLEFDGAGLGGLRHFGADLLDLYVRLQTAAGLYADAPHPKAILKNSGEDLDDAEIESLLAAWEAARATRSTGYLNDVMDYQTFGWNSQELQLVEAREQAALEVARLFGLPASAINATTNSSLTYATVADNHRATLASLRPWMTVIEQTLSLDDRRGVTSGLVTPRGISVTFDADAYTRDDPSTRMNTWAVALTNSILTLDEVRAQEPLAWT